MSVSAVGTEALARATASPVTGTWGTGQSRTAGNLLIAVVAAEGATSVTVLEENNGVWGWAKILEVVNTATAPHTALAFFAKWAVGSDAAPSFTSTLSGTAAMECTLYELSGADHENPIDTTGTQASGATSATITSQTVTTLAAPAAAGEFAILAGCRERTAGTTTITATTFTMDTDDGATSSVGHLGTASLANPSTGAALSGTISYSGTGTSSWGCAGIVVIKADTGVTTPELVFASEVTTTTSGTLTSASFTPQTGDIIVVKITTEDSVNLTYNTPTGGGWVYTSRGIDATASHTWDALWTAPVTSGGTAQTVSATKATGGTTQAAMMTVELWRGGQLAASPATVDARGSGAPSTTLTTAADHSVVSWLCGDWTAVVGTSRIYSSGAAETGYNNASGLYTGYSAFQYTGTAGSETLGISAPAGQTWTIIGVEIQAAAAAPTFEAPTVIVAPSTAVVQAASW